MAASNRPDGSVGLEVRDNGPGMPTLERDVFDRTIEGPLSHSQGIGLWVARTLVAESGGSLRIEDKTPEGSVVRVTLRGNETRRHWET